MHGFTLLEVVIALAAALLLGGMAAASTNRYTDAARVKRATWKLKAHLERMHMQAIMSHQTLSMDPRADVLDGDLGLAGRIDSTPPVVKAFPAGVFTPARITLRGRAAICTITTSLRGRVFAQCG